MPDREDAGLLHWGCHSSKAECLVLKLGVFLATLCSLNEHSTDKLTFDTFNKSQKSVGGIMETEPKEYLGDGVYAIFDGFGIWLHANDHLNPTDKIYLEPSVLKALNEFDKFLKEKYHDTQT